VLDVYRQQLDRDQVDTPELCSNTVISDRVRVDRYNRDPIAARNGVHLISKLSASEFARFAISSAHCAFGLGADWYSVIPKRVRTFPRYAFETTSFVDAFLQFSYNTLRVGVLSGKLM
jgi:hypothetical protein